MNRILFENAEREMDSPEVVCLTGERAAHVRDVLRAAVGDFLRLGSLDGDHARYDRCELLSLDPVRVRLGGAVPPLPRSRVDLLLAIPRPKCLRRLWPQFSALGVGRLYLTAAEKVEKSYWGSTFLDPAVYRPLLLDGLAQAGDTILPEIEIHRRLKPLVQDVLPLRYGDGTRWIAHPPRDGVPAPGPAPTAERILIAVGPEGGWSDFEVGMFEEAGFGRISLGDRILRTDTAVVSILSRYG